MEAAGTVQNAVDLLSQLVSIDSVNLDMPGASGGEKEYSDYLAAYGRKLGLEVSQTEALPGRPNVSLELRTPDATRTLLFDIHLDTVPLGGERGGLAPILENGRLYGRGACDTKGSMASALMAFERLVAEPPTGGCNILLLGTNNNLVGAHFRLSGPWEDPKATAVPLRALASGPASILEQGPTSVVLQTIPMFMMKGIQAIEAMLGLGKSVERSDVRDKTPDVEPDAS